MGRKMSILDKEKRKLNTIHHGAYVSVINEVNVSDYDNISSCTNRTFIEDLVRDYKRIIEIIEMNDSNRPKLNLVEKAVCLAMSLRKNKSIYLKKNVKKGSKLATINERLIIEALLYYLTCSTYRVLDNHKKVLFSGEFDLSGYDNGHKRELASYKKQLLVLLCDSSFNDLAVMDILNQIYLRGVMYKESIDMDLEDKIRVKLLTTETMDVPRIDSSLNPEYVEYKRRIKF